MQTEEFLCQHSRWNLSLFQGIAHSTETNIQPLLLISHRHILHIVITHEIDWFGTNSGP